MQPLTEELAERIDSYIEELFTREDDALRQNVADSAANGLPTIQVSANQGKLLYLIAKMCGARRVLEIGTLGGYSTTWLARALPVGGSVLTLERDPNYADVARRNIERAGVADRVEIRVGLASESLRQLIRDGVPAFDLIFLDADKTGYVEYLDLSLQLARPGTVILADNVIRHGLVMESEPPDPNDRGARAYNQAIATHPRLESVIVPIIRHRMDGLAVSIVR
jgi:predicted O-methyltransferase YrrM